MARRRALLVATALASAGAAPARAADAELAERVQALEQELSLLKRQLEVKQEADDSKSKTAAVAGAGPDGFFLQSQDKKFQVKLRGYVQTDGRFFEEGEQTEGVDTFDMRRVRPIIEGTLGEYVGFRIMPDFGRGTPSLFDAYATLNYWDFAQIWGGKFKPPVSLERLQSATALMFVERAFPTQLAPSRDVGFQLQGDPWKGFVSYQVGAFNGVQNNGSNLDVDTNDGKSVDARVFAHPFQESPWEFLQGLGVGVAGTWGSEFPRLTQYKTSGNQTFFQFLGAQGNTPAVVSVRDHWRITPQGYYYWGPFGMRGEYARSDFEVGRGTRRAGAQVEAWQIGASWVLTGENASYKGVVPRSSLTPDLSHLGAFEVAARYTGWQVNDGVFPVFASPSLSAKRAQAYTLGLNWYLNRWIKLQLNYERTWFNGGAARNKDRIPEGVILSRMQVSY
jgi:phosphate-selective porin OprO/OprP